MTTILISSAGRRVGLANCWRHAAAELDAQLNLLATDARPELSAACNAADESFAVPRCDDPGFVESMLQICRSNNVDLIVPTIDTELAALAESRDRFHELGTRIQVCDLDTVSIVRDKERTMGVLGAAGVPVPATGRPEDVLERPTGWEFPLFVKPRSGSASRGLRRIASPREIEKCYDEPMIVQQYLEGPEYTVNVFVDRAGAVQCVVPHERLQIRAGEVEKGVTRRNPRLEEIAKAIADALPGLTGVFCFQVIADRKSGPRVIEINARFGGGYPLADRAGAKFCRWLLEETLGLGSTANNDWTDGIMMLRYDEAIFLEPS